jgi:hypothetical protein
MMRRPYLLAIAAFSVLATAGASAQDLRQRETEACMGDAFRLCSDAVPDEARVTACMSAKRAQLNPSCRAFFTDASATGDEISPKASRANHKAQPVSVR